MIKVCSKGCGAIYLISLCVLYVKYETLDTGKPMSYILCHIPNFFIIFDLCSII